MNIAFTTIILFIVLAPGFIARQAYHSSKLSVKNPNKNVFNELTFSIIPALFFQICGIVIVNNFTEYYVDFKVLGNLIFQDTKSIATDSAFLKINSYKYPIFFYNSAVFLFAFGVGHFSRKVIRFFKWDRKIRYLRFSNKWHYIFTGECLDFPDVPDEYEDITDKIINVLCKVNGVNVLYTGKFFDYYIDSAGNLEAIHLKYPIRRMLESDNEKDYSKKYFEIESRYLVIPNADIINMNFRYFNLVEIEESSIAEEEKNNAIEIGPSKS